MFRRRACTLVAVLCLAAPALTTAVRAQEALDGPKHIFQDELLEHLVGNWMLTRAIRGQEVQNSVQAGWVLNHQFLQVHMKDVASPPAYEAFVYVGYDNTSERYVVHWLDAYGGRFSETLGFGTRDGNSIRLVFEYPDGPFHNTWTWDPASGSWSFAMKSKDASGQWKPFAEDSLRRAP